jgi:outer membrane protein OmpA-like peptidoglycan-associated protein
VKTKKIHEGGVRMQAITAKRVLIVVIAVFSISLMVGCSGMEKRPANRSGYLYYPTALVNADRALDEARMAGKDKECPAEFNALKDMVDKAYEVYMACHTQEAIDMAQEAIGKIKALCPARPRAEMKPEPKPEPKPVPRPEPKPEPKVVEKVILLEDVHFDLDKSTLTKEAQTILKRNIEVMKENPNVRIRIEGNTSAIATEEYNQRLSERRAKSVEEFLVKEGGIAPDRLTEIGYGETRLEMPEPNPEITESEAAKTNRRVIFKIIVK